MRGALVLLALGVVALVIVVVAIIQRTDAFDANCHTAGGRTISLYQNRPLCVSADGRIMEVPW